MDDDLPPPIPAATLILMRPNRSGAPDILFIERAQTMAFAAGALVFPGGRIDADSGALYSQSALARPNSLSRGSGLRGQHAVWWRRWLGSRAMSAREPGQIRKEAALSGHRQAQRESPSRSDRRR